MKIEPHKHNITPVAPAAVSAPSTVRPHNFMTLTESTTTLSLKGRATVHDSPAARATTSLFLSLKEALLKR